MKNIQLIAPAAFVPNMGKDDLEYLSKQFKKLDCQVYYTDSLFEKKYFLAGDDNTRLNDLEQAFINPKNDFILAIRGGGGSLRLLDKINYSKLKRHPKILIGFSDITVLQNALWEKIKLPSYTGFVGWFGFQKMSPTLLKNLDLCLKNKSRKIPIRTINSGKAQGILLGGNLTAFCSLLGTPYFPKMKGNILLLEEVKEPAYRLDRLINQLYLAGVFNNISGLILGDMTAGLKDQEKKLALQVIKNLLSRLKCPVVSLNGYSHDYKKIVLPIGGKAQIDTTKNILLLDKIEKLV